MLLIAGIPLALLVGAAIRLAHQEQVVVQQQFAGLMQQRLNDVNSNVESHFQRLEAQLLDLTALTSPDVVDLRQIGRTEPLAMQMFLLSATGHLQYPNPAEPLNGDEERFLLKTSGIFRDGHFNTGTTRAIDSHTTQRNTADGTEDTPVVTQDRGSAIVNHGSSGTVKEHIEEKTTAESGWFVWYWDRGLNLIYWNRRPSGQLVGIALDRSRWLSDLVATLPSAPSQSESILLPGTVDPCIQLLDAAANVVYQWGAGADTSSELICEVPLAAPLASWRLKCLLPASQLPGRSNSTTTGLLSGIGAVVIAVGLLAFVLFRDYTRDIREAQQQVSFVNQVSHELKTPLTNIRLYAELLERDLNQLQPDVSQGPRKRVDVILSEGQRLSRLIGNVLALAQQKRKTLQLQKSDCVPDDVIQQVLQHFEPALQSHSIRIATDLQATRTLAADTDFLEQILGNLLSNVEKYASTGEQLIVRSRLVDDELCIDVIDDGPGISVSDQAKIFEPFVRVSQKLHTTSGTGIGLSISRQLARLHGGDLRVVPTKSGCHFEVTLNTGGTGIS